MECTVKTMNEIVIDSIISVEKSSMATLQVSYYSFQQYNQCPISNYLETTVTLPEYVHP